MHIEEHYNLVYSQNLARTRFKLVDEDLNGTAVVCGDKNLSPYGRRVLVLRVQVLELRLDDEAWDGSKDGRRHHGTVSCGVREQYSGN